MVCFISKPVRIMFGITRFFEVGGPSKSSGQFAMVNAKLKHFIIHEGTEISYADIMKIPFYVFLTHK